MRKITTNPKQTLSTGGYGLGPGNALGAVRPGSMGGRRNKAQNETRSGFAHAIDETSVKCLSRSAYRKTIYMNLMHDQEK